MKNTTTHDRADILPPTRKSPTARAVRGVTSGVVPQRDTKPAHAIERSREAQSSTATLERRASRRRPSTPPEAA